MKPTLQRLLPPLLVLASGCAASAMDAKTPATMGAMAGEQAPATPNMTASGPREKPTAPHTPASTQTETKGSKGAKVESLDKTRMLIYVASLALDVEDESVVIGRALTVMDEHGGYLVRRETHTLVLRVPSSALRTAMTDLGKLGRVTGEQVRAEDVTEEFQDAEVRLSNLKVTQKRLQELLSRSGTLADTLTVERELERVTLEIDRIEGRLRLLRERAAMSELTLSLRPLGRAPVVIPPKSERTLPNLGLEWTERVGLKPLLQLGK